MVTKTPKNPKNMALPKGVKSPVDYTKLYMSNELDGEVVSEKKMTKAQIKKRDEIADAISTREMNKRYGDKNVKYAIATKLAMKEDITDEALLIQDWNVDEIKYTEVEAVDIIKPEPLKPSPSNIIIDEGFKTRMIAKFGKKLLKNIGKVNPFTKTGSQRVTGDVIKKTTPKVKGAFDVTGQQAAQMKRTGSGIKFPVRDAASKEISKNIQTKSIINQTKKANEFAAKKLSSIKSTSGKDLSKPIKVNLQKKIDFDKYIGGSSTPIKKKFVEKRPTGTFTDDLPPVKTVPLKKSQIDLMKKTTPKKINKKLTVKDKLKEIENDPMSKKIKKEIEGETGTKTRKFSQKGGVTKGNENETLSNDKSKKPLKDNYNWREDLGEGAGVALKVGSMVAKKAVPALMTTIGGAGTMLQIGKKADEMDFGKSKRTQAQKSSARNQRAVARLGKRDVNVQGNPKKLKQIFTKKITKPKKSEDKVKKEIISKGFMKDHYDWRTELDEDWQKVNRKDKTDGMSKAAVKAYRKENPGSKLKTAVTKDPKKLKKGSKSAKRRLAFCRRMKGMKKKLTSAKTSRDPDSRINKALRRWNC